VPGFRTAFTDPSTTARLAVAATRRSTQWIKTGGRTPVSVIIYSLSAYPYSTGPQVKAGIKVYGPSSRMSPVSPPGLRTPSQPRKPGARLRSSVGAARHVGPEELTAVVERALVHVETRIGLVRETVAGEEKALEA
jgi:hypothetical protein